MPFQALKRNPPPAWAPGHPRSPFLLTRKPASPSRADPGAGQEAFLCTPTPEGSDARGRKAVVPAAAVSLSWLRYERLWAVSRAPPLVRIVRGRRGSWCSRRDSYGWPPLFVFESPRVRAGTALFQLFWLCFFSSEQLSSASGWVCSTLHPNPASPWCGHVCTTHVRVRDE